MEKKLTECLDRLDLEQTETLLKQTKLPRMKRKDARRVKSLLQARLARENGARRRVLPKKLLAAALAAVIVVAGTATAFGDEVVEQLASVINHYYKFIPEYGIVEMENEVQFVLAEQQTAENEDYRLVLNGAYASQTELTLLCKLTRKKLSQEDYLKEQEAPKPGGTKGSQLALYVNGGVPYTDEADPVYTDFTGVTGGDGIEDMLHIRFRLDAGDVGTQQQYRLEYADYGLAVSLRLKPFDSFASLETIGPTDYKNDISITAVPAFSENQLDITLYPINNSPYSILSFSKESEGAETPAGMDLHLQAPSGTKQYVTPGGFMGPNTRFAFPLAAGDGSAILHIPFLLVESQEFRVVNLKIPKKGECVTVNREIAFRDATMTIATLERSDSVHIGEYGELKMTLRYENKDAKKIMRHVDYQRVSAFGKLLSGTAGSWLPDENGVTQELYLALERGERGSVNLRFENPEYFLMDAYTLPLEKPGK